MKPTHQKPMANRKPKLLEEAEEQTEQEKFRKKWNNNLTDGEK